METNGFVRASLELHQKPSIFLTWNFVDGDAFRVVGELPDEDDLIIVLNWLLEFGAELGINPLRVSASFTGGLADWARFLWTGNQITR